MECDMCDSTPVMTQQILNNQLRIADEKRKSSGLLTSYEIKAVRELYKLTQKEAAEIFGGGKNAFSKYERGDVIQSEAMDKLLRLVFVNPKNLDELLSRTIGSAIELYSWCTAIEAAPKIRTRCILVRNVEFIPTTETFDWGYENRMRA